MQVGETDKGVLWRLETEPAEREGLTRAEAGTSSTITAIQLIVLMAALLLAIPTRASRRAARAHSRIVGRSPEEPLILPRRRDEPLDEHLEEEPEPEPEPDESVPVDDESAPVDDEPAPVDDEQEADSVEDAPEPVEDAPEPAEDAPETPDAPEEER